MLEDLVWKEPWRLADGREQQPWETDVGTDGRDGANSPKWSVTFIIFCETAY